MLSKMRREKKDLGSDLFKVRRNLIDLMVQGPKVVQTRAGQTTTVHGNDRVCVRLETH